MPKINQEEYEVLKGLGNTWKWIARDKDGVLGVYDAKVVKTKFHNFWVMAIKKKIDLTLFSFIQWEDEEPYSIAELIEEYEVQKKIEVSVELGEQVIRDHARKQLQEESEETEVKSKQELIEKWESAIESAEFYGKGKEEELISYMKDFVSDLNQLDEPEATLDRALEKVAESYPMTKEEIWRHLERLVAYGGKVIYGELDEPEVLSQGWIDEHRKSYTMEDSVEISDLQNLLVPKQDKPVIPKFVADWIELSHGRHHSLHQTMIEYCPREVLDWIVKYPNSRKFARAWLDGFTVEEEQKYQVIIRDGEYVRLYLCKNNGNVTIGTNDNYIEKCPEVTYLTEQEIKDYDERFWAFAVKVEELEE